MNEVTTATRRVVITAVGAVTAQGTGVAALWEGVRDGRVAIRPVQGLPLTGYRTSIGGQVPDMRRPTYDYLTELGIEHPEPALDFALVAAEEAMAAAGIAVPADRWGVAFGTCNGGTFSGEQALRRARHGSATPGGDRHLLLVPPHGLAEALSAAFGLAGPVVSVNTACASGAHAIAHATEIIRAGRADAMLVGGSDALTESAFAGFDSVEALSERPCAPYSRDRDGLSLGEGSGMLVLAEESIARAAGAPILAEVLGYGMSADGYHPTAPHPQGEGAARAIRAALDSGGLVPTDVAYINGHGTGTPKNDPAECNAVRAAFGDAADKVVLSSTKSMIGHLLGAAGAVEGIVTVLALREQLAPPTAGFTAVDPRCGLDAAPGTARPAAIGVALSNNFAFGGANATVAFRRPGELCGDPAAGDTDAVVVTGLGVLAPGGTSADELWQTFRAGRRLGREERGLRVAQLEADLDAYTTPRERRRMDRFGRLAVATCRIALEDAGLEPDERTGVVLGTGIGPMRSIEDFFLPMLAGGPSMSSPAIFPNTVFNAAAGQVAMVLGAKGPTSTATAAHAAGASALTIAFDLLRTGKADAILCPAVDELTEHVIDAYRGMPLFGGRTGWDYLLAEGSVTLLLERASTAASRGAPILAEFAGHATTSDALGIGRWDRYGHGIERAMRNALADARIDAAQLSAIWTNAAGLRVVDGPEIRAIDRLGPPERCRREAPKRVLGEPIGAGAQLAAALATASFRHDTSAGPVLINSSSLGGTHTSLVLHPPQNRPPQN
ncbi:beta-ketoacyl synthase N-terminal-like domain-containing protein [Nocardia sp. bgisy134]|uniref:beta-ketoacyl synthase N-terminal-like domain-containing protein n=1 Tax=Nocardia sp. bgisy134 TaxID=3413789 RepID=UPI003D747764